MEHLFDFGCELFVDKNVSCLSWNSAKKEVLAVGYGRFQFTYKAGKFSAKPSGQPEGVATGHVAVWSLTSPSWPLFHVETPSGVTSIDWR